MNFKACPGCDSREALVISGAPELRVLVGGAEFVQPPYDVLRCARCDLHYKSRIMTPNELERYYKLVDFQKWCPPERSPIDELCSKLLGEVPRGGKILDFGCSTGRLLSRFVPTHRCYGVEVNSLAAGEARRRGIQVVDEGDLDSVGSLDAVVMSDVYEHLVRPVDTVVRLLGLVRTGGRLVVATGNADSWVFRAQKGGFWYFRTPEHISMLTRRHLHYLARRSSARLVRWIETSHYRVRRSARSRQVAELLLYAALNGGASRIVRPAVGAIPVLKRALLWREAPVVNGFRDHVVAALQRGIPDSC
jgi:SAM-dependent methyltransferase